MSADIISLLQLDTVMMGNVITVKEKHNCDSSFITSCIINHCTKNKRTCFIVSMHNSLMHYQQIGLKLNYNLQKNINSGLISFYNLGEQIVNRLLLDQCSSLDDHYSTIKYEIEKLQSTYNGITIIIDGISHLFDLEYTIKEVNLFCNNIVRLTRNLKNSAVFLHCNISCEEDVTCSMSNLLAHMSQIVIEVENLPSGLSTDVSGHLTIKYLGLKFQDVHMFNLDQKTNKYLFKLFERGVKLLAPGTV